MALALVMAPILTLVLTFGRILAQAVSEYDSDSDSGFGFGSGSGSGFARHVALTLTLILALVHLGNMSDISGNKRVFRRVYMHITCTT